MKEILNFFSRFNSDYFFADPSSYDYNYFLLATFGLLFILGLIFRVYWGKLFAEKDPRKPILKLSFWIIITLAALGLLIVFFRFQEIPFLTKRIFLYFDLSLLVIYLIGLSIYLKKVLPEKLYNFMNSKRKEKWLPKKKGR